jgi:hypothetical protein
VREASVSVDFSANVASGSGGGPPRQPGGLHRAQLTCRETNEALEVHFNPTQVHVNKTAYVTVPATPAAKAGSHPQYINTHTRTFAFALTLDAWSTGKDVPAAVTTLQSWMNPTQKSLALKQPAPATVELQWWHDAQPLVGVITQANATYTVFDTSGRPVRATVDMSIKELPEDPPPSNPTSGTPAPGRTVLVREGDTLASIAYREYHDPSLWRGLARANAITDPLAVAPGQRLQVPMRSVLTGGVG